MPHDRDKATVKDRAVVVLGHGSRAVDSGRPLEWVASELAARIDCRVVPAFLQFNQPGLGDACRELVAAGARHIFIAPYFLFEGNHMREDIPREIEQMRRELPGVTFTLAATLGIDDNMVRLLSKRLTEAGFSCTGKQEGAAGNAARHPIESESFSIIDGLVEPEDADDPRYLVSRRVIHATGDPELAGALVFSEDAVDAASAAFEAGARLFADVKMVAAGIEPTATRAGLEVACGIADGATAALAASEGITRGAAAFRRSYIEDDRSLDGAVVAIGNAPTALFELLRLVREEGVRPALVIGVPVGFVGASESKEELAQSDIAFITLPGNRGGSNVAAAIVNALLRIWSGPGKQEP